MKRRLITCPRREKIEWKAVKFIYVDSIVIVTKDSDSVLILLLERRTSILILQYLEKDSTVRKKWIIHFLTIL